MVADGWTMIGTIADTIAGLGTLGALVWAIFLYRRQVQDRHIEQASKVFISLVKEGGDYQELVIDNNSDMPVFAVYIKLLGSGGLIQSFQVDRVPPGEPLSFTEVADPKLATVRLNASMVFQDAAGRPWARTTAGTLRPAKGELNRYDDPEAVEDLYRWLPVSASTRMTARLLKWLRRRGYFGGPLPPVS